MPIDVTDRQLIKGAIWFAVILLAALFMPWYGYLTKIQDEEKARDTLRETGQQYCKFFGNINPVSFGENPVEEDRPKTGILQEELKKEYEGDNQDIEQAIKIQQEKSRVAFASWTEPPSGWKEFGTYFDKMFQKIKKDVAEMCRNAKVSLDDPDIGFKKYSGLTMEEKKSKEYLRELYIAEKIISLCLEAKKEQEKDEIMVRQVKPEAFMRIISVTPEESEPSGPSMLIPNPNFNEAALKNDPMSEKAKPFLVKRGQLFIQEYPVEIVLQCDVNTFMRFLHSVRVPGQYLVIRSLEIISPSMQDSAYSKGDFDKFMRHSNEDSKLEANKDERVFIRMSAEGMDFFDNGVCFYSSKDDSGRRVRTKANMNNAVPQR